MSSSLIIKKQNKKPTGVSSLWPLGFLHKHTRNKNGGKKMQSLDEFSSEIFGRQTKMACFCLIGSMAPLNILREYLTLHSLSASQGLISSVHDTQNGAVVEHRGSNTGPDEMVSFKFEGVHHYSNADGSCERVHFYTQKNQQCNASCAQRDSSVEVLGKPHKEARRQKINK